MLVVAFLGYNWYKYCLNTPNLSLTYIISQMHWIVIHFDHRNPTKLFTPSQQILLVLAFFFRENGYKCCLNTLNPSLTLIISQMHWILKPIDHKNTNKSIE